MGGLVKVAKRKHFAGSSLPPPKEIRVEELYLDAKNPRLAGTDLSVDDQQEIVEVLWQDRAVIEIVDSIVASGYWKHEILFATRELGKLVVIEGNRRLTAVKLLLDDELRQRVGLARIPSLSPAQRQQLQTLPVVECSREDLWQYIGFKHVNGPQDWDSIAKAQFIASVHNEYSVPLETIARTIGDRHDTVKRLYRGLMVLDQAERTGKFDREDRWNTRFAYSHLWTGLGYSNIQSYLGLNLENSFSRNPVPNNRLDRLSDLCVWLYGSKKLNKAPLIRSQNPDLRTLDEVLGSKDGVAALNAGLPLDTSLKASRGDPRLFREALVVAEQKLKDARGLVMTGYRGELDLLNKGHAISTIADSIVVDMEKLAKERNLQGRKRRRSGDEK